MKLSEIKPNPSNPRLIKDDKFKKLVNSILEFPEMMEKRPMVCVSDKNAKYPLGGNMRYNAIVEIKKMGREAVLSYLKEVGKEVNIGKIEQIFNGIIPEMWVLMADDWTQEQRKEFIIKDNVSFGEHDWDILANEWDSEQLTEWGVDVPVWDNIEIGDTEVKEKEIKDTIFCPKCNFEFNPK